MKKIVVTAVILAFVASCSQKGSIANESFTSSAKQIAEGKTIFENSCGKCHKLPDPTSHSTVDWVGIMNRMAPKSKLTEEQHQWVYDYIVSVKKQ